LLQESRSRNDDDVKRGPRRDGFVRRCARDSVGRRRTRLIPRGVGWPAPPVPRRDAIIGAASAETLERLQHAYALREELDPAWAARPIRLEPRQGRLTLLSEDPGGESLLKLMGRPWEITAFLHLAIGIATALARV